MAHNYPDKTDKKKRITVILVCIMLMVIGLNLFLYISNRSKDTSHNLSEDISSEKISNEEFDEYYYPSNWSDDSLELGNWIVPYKILEEPIYDCTSVGIELVINNVEDGNPYGEWEVYIRSLDGGWKALNKFVYDEGNTSVTVDTNFDVPTSVK